MVNVHNNNIQRAPVPLFSNVNASNASNSETLEVPNVIDTSNEVADDDSYVSLASNNFFGNNHRALHNIGQVVLHSVQPPATTLRNDNQLAIVQPPATTVTNDNQASFQSIFGKKKDIYFISNAIPELQLVSAVNSHSVVKDMFQERFVCINDTNYSLIGKDRVRNNNGNNLSTCVYICSCQVGSIDPSKLIRMRFSTPFVPTDQTRPEYLFQVTPPNGLDRDLLRNHYRRRGPNDIRTIKSTTYDLPVVLEEFDGNSVMTNVFDSDINSEIIRTQCSIAAINALQQTDHVMASRTASFNNCSGFNISSAIQSNTAVNSSNEQPSSSSATEEPEAAVATIGEVQLTTAGSTGNEPPPCQVELTIAVTTGNEPALSSSATEEPEPDVASAKPPPSSYATGTEEPQVASEKPPPSSSGTEEPQVASAKSPPAPGESGNVASTTPRESGNVASSQPLPGAGNRNYSPANVVSRKPPPASSASATPKRSSRKAPLSSSVARANAATKASSVAQGRAKRTGKGNVSVAKKKKTSEIAAAQRRLLESDDDDDDSDEDQNLVSANSNVANLKDDSADVELENDNDIDTPLINIVKQEPPDAAEEIAKRGRKPMSEKDIFEKLYMLSTTEHKLRLGFYDQKINEPITVGEDDTAVEDDFVVNDDFLAKLPTKLQLVTTCVICLGDIDITKECVINLNCEKTYPRIPHPIHKTCYDPMITWDVRDIITIPTTPTSILPPPDRNDVKVVQKCPVCRAEGDYILSTFNANNSQWERWIKPPDGIPGVTVYGGHRYTGYAQNRQYQHYIISEKLMHSICRALKVEGPRVERPIGFPIRNCRPMWLKYCWMNNDIFMCRHCDFSCLNLFKIILRGCKDKCEYCICRDCFLNKITTEEEIPGFEKNDGYLKCPYCKQTGRAFYDGAKRPVAAKDRKGLTKKKN